MTTGLDHWQCPRNRVVERGRSIGMQARQFLADQGVLRRPALYEAWPRVEAIQEHFVARPEQSLQESIERSSCRLNFCADHAAARVEDDPEAERNAFGAEVRNLDSAAIFVHREIGLFQTGHESTVAVDYRCGDVDEFDA
jgi:hypothetical protein